VNINSIIKDINIDLNSEETSYIYIDFIKFIKNLPKDNDEYLKNIKNNDYFLERMFREYL
jgi:hypothetical protein